MALGLRRPNGAKIVHLKSFEYATMSLYYWFDVRGTVAMSADTATPQTVIDYRIDRKDRIVTVSGNWQTFAMENGGSSSLMNIVGQSLWDHICDKDTQDIYIMLLDAVRASGSGLSFPYRCDSPCVKRYMRLTITAEPDSGIAFRSEILKIEPMARPVYFDITSSYKIKQVHVCSSCRKVKAGESWLEVADAFETGDLTATKSRFLAIYRMCSTCLAAMHERSSELLARASGRMDRLKATIERYHQSQTEGYILRRLVAEQRVSPAVPSGAEPDKSG